MTDLDALTAIHRAQEALALCRERRAAQDRVRPRRGRWSDKHWMPYHDRALDAIHAASAAVDHSPVPSRPILDHVVSAGWTLLMMRSVSAQLLLDTAERLLREHLEERRVG